MKQRFCEWKKLEEWTPPMGEPVLTYHENDAYPIVAFCLLGNLEVWYAPIEHPSDETLDVNVRLWRKPTHWAEIPHTPFKPEKMLDC